MRLSEHELADLFRDESRRAGRDRCPDAETLTALAAGQLDRPRRDAALDHLAACRDCAEEVRLLGPFEEWSSRAAGAPLRGGSIRHPSFSRAAAYALAASLTLPLSGLAIWQWLAIRELHDTLDNVPAVIVRRTTPPQQTETSPPPDAAARIAALEAEVRELSQPQLNPSIIDLEPDSLRGDDGAQIVEVARDARFFNVILSVSSGQRYPDYSLEIRDANRAVLWRGAGLRRTEYETFTVALPARLFPAGEYELRLMGLRGGREELLQTYAVRLRYD